MDLDIDTSTKILIGLATAIAATATYFRSEKVKNAAATADVADLNLKTVIDNGQAEEIVSLRERLNSLDNLLSVQSSALAHTMSRISALEAAHLGVSMHVDNLLLCETCTSNNEKVLVALHKALDGIDMAEIRPGMQY